MTAASITHEDRLLLDRMATLSMSGTRVDRVYVVEASTDGVAFNNSIAHAGKLDDDDEVIETG